jgi:hypothetical protein
MRINGNRLPDQVCTGSICSFASTNFTNYRFTLSNSRFGRERQNFDWLLDIHKGNFGIINLSSVYPFLNALGLLIMALAGITLWFKGLRKKKPSSITSESSEGNFGELNLF